MQVESIPTLLADFWDISLESAQVILSIIVILAVLLPLFVVTKGRNNLAIVVLLFLSEALLVGIGWLPFWILIATVAVSALAIALFSSRLVTGE